MEPLQPGSGFQANDSAKHGPRFQMTTTDDTDWRTHGACISADPELFFPISSSGASRRQEKRAKAICAVCRVSAECLAFALETRQVHGVWGGLGEEELRRLRRRRRISHVQSAA
jgi:WhiB family redox-sensing transcriptional regulator